MRNPGESIQEEMERLVDDRLVPVFIVAVLASTIAMYEWWRVFSAAPPRPLLISLFAVGAAGFAAYRTLSLRKRVRSLRLGLEGEKVVGQNLEVLRTHGYRVFHDVVADGFNVDHVIVGAAGVFVIETKTFSKPMKGDAKVTYDGDTITLNGWEPPCNPVRQARANRDWIRDLLYERTGERYKVKGVVLMPGWWVDPPADKKRAEVWVLNPKMLLPYLKHEPAALAPEEVALLSSRIHDYVTRS